MIRQPPSPKLGSRNSSTGRMGRAHSPGPDLRTCTAGRGRSGNANEVLTSGAEKPDTVLEAGPRWRWKRMNSPAPKDTSNVYLHVKQFFLRDNQGTTEQLLHTRETTQKVEEAQELPRS